MNFITTKMEEGKFKKGWILTGVVFVFFFMIVGLSKCFSIFYLELLEKFDTSATVIGWLIGAQNLARLGLGKCYYSHYYVRRKYCRSRNKDQEVRFIFLDFITPDS